jgi:hypothetical protein
MDLREAATYSTEAAHAMTSPAHILLGALLLSFFPAQTKEMATRAKVASSMSIETGDEVCAELSAAECCGQMLELAGFRAQGDHLPRLIKTSVHLACTDEHKTVTSQVCKSIAVSRGFSPKDADAICKPAQRECQKDGTCRQCVSDLAKLEYRGSHHVCHALTYVPERASPRVVVIRNGSIPASDSDTHFEVTRRRTTVR